MTWVPRTLVRTKTSGPSMLRSTWDSAAKWTTCVGWYCAKTASTAGRSATSACTKVERGSPVTSLTLSGLPAYVSASRLMRWISGYCFICWRTKQEPMKPQPPVTRMVSVMGQYLLIPKQAIVEGVFPGTQAVQLFEIELAVGQHRVDGPARRCRVIHGVNGYDGNIQAQAVHDAGGEGIPAGLPRVHAVVRPGTAILDGCPELVHDVLGEGGTADLVVHDAQLVLLTGKAQDGADEVVSGAAVQPGETQDEMVRVGLPGRLLAQQFCPAVDGEGTRGSLLVVGRGRRAVEDIIGGEVHDTGTDTLCRLGHVAGTQDVDTVRRILVGLSPVHGGIGCTVDYDLGVGSLYCFPQGGTVGDVQLVHDTGGHVDRGRQEADDVTAKLTIGTDNKKFHCTHLFSHCARVGHC